MTRDQFMIDVRRSLFAIGLLLSAPTRGFAQPPPGAPPPPPPPPATETDHGKTVLAELSNCYAQPDQIPIINARRDAEQATKRLQAAPGSTEWNSAREVVLAYVKTRQLQQACIARADHLSQIDLTLSALDRKALRFHVYAYAEGWSEQARYETGALVALLDAHLAADIDHTPAINLMILGARTETCPRH